MLKLKIPITSIIKFNIQILREINAIQNKQSAVVK